MVNEKTTKSYDRGNKSHRDASFRNNESRIKEEEYELQQTYSNQNMDKRLFQQAEDLVKTIKEFTQWNLSSEYKMKLPLETCVEKRAIFKKLCLMEKNLKKKFYADINQAEEQLQNEPLKHVQRDIRNIIAFLTVEFESNLNEVDLNRKRIEMAHRKFLESYNGVKIACDKVKIGKQRTNVILSARSLKSGSPSLHFNISSTDQSLLDFEENLEQSYIQNELKTDIKSKLRKPYGKPEQIQAAKLIKELQGIRVADARMAFSRQSNFNVNNASARTGATDKCVRADEQNRLAAIQGSKIPRCRFNSTADDSKNSKFLLNNPEYRNSMHQYIHFTPRKYENDAVRKSNLKQRPDPAKSGQRLITDVRNKYPNTEPANLSALASSQQRGPAIQGFSQNLKKLQQDIERHYFQLKMNTIKEIKSASPTEIDLCVNKEIAEALEFLEQEKNCKLRGLAEFAEKQSNLEISNLEIISESPVMKKWKCLLEETVQNDFPLESRINDLYKDLDSSTTQQRISGSNGQQRICGSNGQPRISGSNGQQRISGSNVQQRFSDNNGQQRISGSNGQQRISGSNGQQRIFGSNGQHRIPGSNGQQRVFGSNGEQRISGINGQQRISGINGQQRIAGINGQQRIAGINGQQRIFDINGQHQFPNSNGQNQFSNSTGQQQFSNSNGQQQFSNRNGQQWAEQLSNSAGQQYRHMAAEQPSLRRTEQHPHVSNGQYFHSNSVQQHSHRSTGQQFSKDNRMSSIYDENYEQTYRSIYDTTEITKSRTDHFECKNSDSDNNPLPFGQENADDIFKNMMQEKYGLNLTASPADVMDKLIGSNFPKLRVVEDSTNEVIPDHIPTNEMNVMNYLPNKVITETLKMHRPKMPQLELASLKLKEIIPIVELNQQADSDEIKEIPVMLNSYMCESYFQARGTSLPKWFPGYFSVAPVENATGVLKQNSFSGVLRGAWEKMGPAVER